MKRGQRLFLIFLIFALLLCSSAMAFESTMVSMADTDRGDEQIEQRAEQTEWVYRYYNGKLQRRLWSITYGKWLTDWIDCEP